MASTIIAIGDELLGGFTLDTNSHWLAGRLRRAGYPAKRITITADREAEIVAALRRDLADPEVEDVLCSGGLGPTPDDRTFESVAAALGREVVTWQPVLERIARRARRMHAMGLLETPEVSEGNVRMARIPADPDHVFRNRRGAAPGLMYRVDGRRLFVLPGVPGELRGIVTEELEPEFLTGRVAAVVRELKFAFAAESRFYPLLRELETTHPDVSVGSYPNVATRELTLRFMATDERQATSAVEAARRRAVAMGLPPTP